MGFGEDVGFFEKIRLKNADRVRVNLWLDSIGSSRDTGWDDGIRMKRALATISEALREALFGRFEDAGLIHFEDGSFDGLMDLAKTTIFLSIPDHDAAETILVQAVRHFVVSGRRLRKRTGTKKVRLTDAQAFHFFLCDFLDDCEKCQEFIVSSPGMFGLEFTGASPRLSQYLRDPELAARSVTQVGLAVRFIRYVVRVSAENQNPLWPLQGVPRLVFSFSNDQVAGLGDEIVPERVKGNRRSQQQVQSDIRGALMDGLSQRFRGWVERADRAGNEERRFRGQESSTATASKDMAELVLACLEVYAPWGFSPPLLPEASDPDVSDLVRAWIRKQKSSEMAFAYAVVHPALFRSVSRELFETDPVDSIRLPRFGFPGKGLGRRNAIMSIEQERESRFSVPSAATSEIRMTLMKDAARRSGFKGNPTVSAGTESGIVRPGHPVTFALEGNERHRIVVEGEDDAGRFPLAVFTISPADLDSRASKGRVLREAFGTEGGQRFRLESRKTPGTDMVAVTIDFQRPSSLNHRSAGLRTFAACGVLLLAIGLIWFFVAGVDAPILVEREIPAPPPNPPREIPPPFSPPTPPPVIAKGKPLYFETGDSDLEQRFWASVKSKLDGERWKIVRKPETGCAIVQTDRLMGGEEGVSIRIEILSSKGRVILVGQETLTEENWLKKASEMARAMNRVR